MVTENSSADYIIIGGGIAGASAGYELAKKGKVILLEKESQPGYHTTGRSAAVYTTTYNQGDPVLRALVLASADHLFHPPEGFSPHPLLHPRDMVYIAPADQKDALLDLYQSLKKIDADVRMIDQHQLKSMLPLITPEYGGCALFEKGMSDMDVHALHEGFLRGMRDRGAEIHTDAPVISLIKDSGKWRVETDCRTYEAPVVINAAGAWVDEIATLAGVKKIGIQPLRRTALLISPPEGFNVESWPFVMEAVEGFYFKPDAGKIMISPADATLSEPCDAQPEEIDVAYGAHYLEKTLNFKVDTVEHSWAGLRNQVSDGHPVVGFAPDAQGFFWLAAQGGFGVKTSPALGRITASLIAGQGLPQDVRDLGLKEDDISVCRLF